MTSRLLTLGEGETDELSMEMEKSFILERVDLVPKRRISVLSQLSEVGGRVVLGLGDK